MAIAAQDISFERLRAQFEDGSNDEQLGVSLDPPQAAAPAPGTPPAARIDAHASALAEGAAAAPQQQAVGGGAEEYAEGEEEEWTDSDDEMAAALEWADEQEGGWLGRRGLQG